MGSMDTEQCENRIECLKSMISMMKEDKQNMEKEKEDDLPLEPKKKEDNSNLIHTRHQNKGAYEK